MTKGSRRTSTKRDLAVFVLLLAALGLVLGARTPSASARNEALLGPLALYALPASQRASFEGRVIERAHAGSYTYLLVERASGERSWVVTLASSVGAGPHANSVKVLTVGYAAHFNSKRLSRTFDGLYFGVVRPA